MAISTLETTIESILFRRSCSGRLEGYTLETTLEIVQALQQRETEVKFLTDHLPEGSY
jgi:hypothetical protein